MTVSREGIMINLLGLFNGINSPFKTVSRKFKMWNEVGRDQRPALFLLQTGETAIGGQRLTPSMIEIEVRLFVYTWAKEHPLPASLINPLLDYIDQMIKGSPQSGKQTLGGLVDHVWREGQALFVAGDLEGDGMAVIPIRVRVPSFF